MREIKFRAWNKKNKTMMSWDDLASKVMFFEYTDNPDYPWMQFTGLLDRNGKEIYEFMELDNKWEVDWINGKYILRDISSGDIIDLKYENSYEITRDYTKI